MKQFKIISFLSLAALFSLTSCLKERAMNIDTSKGPANVIEFSNAGTDQADYSKSHFPNYYTDFGVLNVGDSSKLKVNISYSGADVAPQDITVNLTVDPSIITTYNSDNGTSFTAAPQSIYRSVPSSVIIKKGTQFTQIEVTVLVNSSFDFGASYAIPLKISSASMGTISGNYSNALFSFGVRNKYDGIYTMSGTLTDVVAPTITGWYPLDMQLITHTANSIALWDPNYAKTYGHPIKSGGSSSYYGSFSPVFYFDEAGNVTKVENLYGQPAANGRSAVLDATGVNKITFNSDGTVKKFQVKYIMIQAGNPRTTYDETFVYKSAR